MLQANVSFSELFPSDLLAVQDDNFFFFFFFFFFFHTHIDYAHACRYSVRVAARKVILRIYRSHERYKTFMRYSREV
jgi:hypothetical protein